MLNIPMMRPQKKRSLKKTWRRARKILSFVIKSRRMSIRGINRLGHRATTTEVFGVSLEKPFNVRVLSSCKDKYHAPKPQSMRSSLSARALPPRKDPPPTSILLDECTHPSTHTSERTQCLTACHKRLQVLVCVPSFRCEVIATWAFGVHSRYRTALPVLHIHLQAPPVLSLIHSSHRNLTRCSTLAYLLSLCRIRTKKLLRPWNG